MSHVKDRHSAILTYAIHGRFVVSLPLCKALLQADAETFRKLCESTTKEKGGWRLRRKAAAPATPHFIVSLFS
eukprot:4304081-Amphidinium_carterae.1